MESKHADPEPEAAPAPEPPAAQPAAAPDAAVAAEEGDVVQVLESPPPRNGPVGAKTALGLMAAAVAKERAKPAAGVAKPVPAPKRKPSIFGKPKRKASIFEPPSIDEIQVPDGLSPAMRAAYIFSARTSGGGYDPLAGSGVRSREDLVHHFERLDQKKQGEIERKKREAARIRAGGGQGKGQARGAHGGAGGAQEETGGAHERGEEGGRAQEEAEAGRGLKRAGCLVDRPRHSSSRK